MAARRIPRKRRAPAQARARRKTRASLQRSLARMEEELPRTLAQFSRRVQARLGDLEKRLQKAGAVYRRRGTRLLREASHQLGRFEAEGELRWRRLTARARRDALQVLRRLERELGPAPKARKKVAKPRHRKLAARKPTAVAPSVAARLEAVGTGI